MPFTVVPVVSLLYAVATPDHPHRLAMAAITLAMIAVCGTVLRCPGRTGRPVLDAAGATLQLLGAALLGYLDGGVAGPSGVLLPAVLVIVALRFPPRTLVVLATIGAAGYGTVALLGDPAPSGYAAACALGFGGVSYLCMRHAAALASLRRRLDRVSGTDPLTGALNRRGFDERLAADFATAVRTGTPITLVLADLDLFKEVNDTYGHQAGDQLLAAVAGGLRARLRPGDVVGRVGGDEFAVVLPGVGPEEAAATVQRLRRRLDDVAPASLGYACHPADGATVADLRRTADARVYEDKLGRQRRPPRANAVAEARRAGTRSAEPVPVSGRERRRRSFADIGWMSMLGGGCGLLYGLAYAAPHPHRPAITLLAGMLLASGAAMVSTAGRLSRFSRAREVMFTSALVQVAQIGGMAALDGGVTGVPALALLVPAPLIALSSPLRVSGPVISLFAAVYLAVAGLVGASSVSYVAMHLGGIAVISAICAAQGRAAGRDRRRLTELTRRDALTEVLNRRGFEQRFAGVLEQAGLPAALLVFDLDGFKEVNDRDGHEAGDELLRWVAATLTAHLEPGAAVGRFGGDEFVVLLTAEDATRAPAVAHRLRRALTARTSVSLGIAVHGRDGEDLEILYAHADAGLYAEKHLRRQPALLTRTCWRRAVIR